MNPRIFLSVIAACLAMALSGVALTHLQTQGNPAIMQPLNGWQDMVLKDLGSTTYEIWVCYPESKLSAADRTWIGERRKGERFYLRMDADPSLTIVDGSTGEDVKIGGQDRSPTAHMKDWIGERAGTFAATEGSTYLLKVDPEAAAKLGKVRARIMVDLPQAEKVKRIRLFK